MKTAEAIRKLLAEELRIKTKTVDYNTKRYDLNKTVKPNEWEQK